MEKIAFEVWKNILQISNLVFWMLKAAKYLSCDFTFTFYFFFICTKLNWPFFHLSGIFTYEKMMDKVEIAICNIWFGENGRQSSEILNEIAPIALIA